MSKLLICDKDGTLIQPTSKTPFILRPWLQMPIDGVYKSLEKYKEEGWKIIIASNQGGIGGGYKSLEFAFMEFEYCLELFPMIDECFFCPDLEGLLCWRMWRSGERYEDLQDDNHRILYTNTHSDYGNLSGEFRKPKGGMLKLADNLFPSNECFFIGDMKSDEKAAEYAEIPFKWAKELRA